MTFPASEGCNENLRYFIAHSDQLLPSKFQDVSGVSAAPSSSLQLHVSEEGTVVTLVATWINTTIIVRRIAGFLAVTLTVGGQMTFSSQGLCVAGCPEPQTVGKYKI